VPRRINQGCELSPLEHTATLNYSVNHARSGSNSCSASLTPWLISTSPLPAPPFCTSDDFHVLSRASGPSCNQLRNSSHTPRQLSTLRIGDGGFTIRRLCRSTRASEFLGCACLASGFARFHRDACGPDRLVPFSCKGRGSCPSCGGRRMAERAAHLIDHVFSDVPVRQWVLSLPYRLRYLLAWDHDLCRAVVAVYVRAPLGFLRRRASGRCERRTRWSGGDHSAFRRRA
jgi:hypothetical protein